jgi:hypothetical protein
MVMMEVEFKRCQAARPAAASHQMIDHCLRSTTNRRLSRAEIYAAVSYTSLHLPVDLTSAWVMK